MVYKFTKTEFEKYYKLLDDAYNITYLIQYYCKNHSEDDGINYILPAINSSMNSMGKLINFLLEKEDSPSQ